jgi:hypothetical protein
MKRTLMVRYRTHEDQAATHAALVSAVFEELAALRPPGLRYAAWQVGGGAAFAHLAEIDTVDGGNPLLEIGSFKRFQQALRERCAEPPQPAELTGWALTVSTCLGPDSGSAFASTSASASASASGLGIRLRLFPGKPGGDSSFFAPVSFAAVTSLQ